LHYWTVAAVSGVRGIDADDDDRDAIYLVEVPFYDRGRDGDDDDERDDVDDRCLRAPYAVVSITYASTWPEALDALDAHLRQLR